MIRLPTLILPKRNLQPSKVILVQKALTARTALKATRVIHLPIPTSHLHSLRLSEARKAFKVKRVIPVRKALKVILVTPARKALKVTKVTPGQKAKRVIQVLPVPTELMPLSPELQLLLMPTPVHRPLL